jgi:hypothetical protein
MRQREAEMMKGEVSEATKKQVAAASAAVDKAQSQIDALAKQIIQVQSTVKLDSRVIAEAVERVQRNKDNRQGGKPEGKNAPTKDLKS